MGLLSRFGDAIQTLWRGRPLEQPTSAGVAASMVLGWEQIDHNRTVQSKAAQMLSYYSGTAATCANIQSNAVASVPWKIYRKARPIMPGIIAGPRVPVKQLARMKRINGQSVKKAIAQMAELEEITDPNHPAVKLFTNPWPGGNWFELLCGTNLHLTFTGNSYWLIVLGAGQWPVELWPGHPAQTRVVPDKERFIGCYVNGRSIETEVHYAPELVAHFKNINVQGDPYYGRGEIETLLVPIQLEAAIDQHAISTLNSGVTPGARIMPKESNTFSETVKSQIETMLRSKHEGTQRGGRSMVFSVPVEFQESNLGEKELAFQRSLQDARQRIANGLGIPMSYLTMDSAALASAQAATPLFQKLALTPRCQRIEDTINGQIMPHFGRGLGEDYVFAFDHAEEKENRADQATLVQLTGCPILTVNEAREEIGEEPIPGGDTLTKPAAPTPGGGLFGMFGSPNAPPKAHDAADGTQGPPGKYGDPGPKPPDPDEKDMTGGQNLGKTYGGLFSGLHAKSCGCCDHAPRTTRAGRLTVRKDDKRAPLDVPGILDDAERELIERLIHWFDGVAGTVDAARIAETGTVDLSSNRGLLEMFQSLTEGPLARAMLAGHNLGATEGPVEGDVFAVLNAPAVAELRATQLVLADDVLQSAEAGIRGALEQVINEGGNLQDKITAIRNVVPSASGYAAERIARTESAKAFCNGRENGWMSTDAVAGKEWLLSGNPCKLCRALNGKKVPLKQPFALAGDILGGIKVRRNIDNPPAHPACSCDVGAVWKKDVEGDKTGQGNVVDKGA